MIDYDHDFLKVPRGIVRALQRDPIALQVYLECYLRVRWEDGFETGPRGLIPIRAGSAMVGRNQLSTSMATSEASIRSALSRLQALGFVTIQGTTRGSIVTLTGYCEMGDAAPAQTPAEPRSEHQQVASNSPAETTETNQRDDQQITTNVDLRSSDLREEKESAHAREELTNRQQLRTRTWKRLEQLRTEIAAELGTMARPLPAFDPGEVELAARIVEAGSIERAEADIDHVFAIAAAEARAPSKRTIQWLAGGMFKSERWSVALGKTVEDAGRDRGGPRSVREDEPIVKRKWL